ncbi:MAG TPA: chemotaxis protein CheA [Candidatus Acidoferrum sp.]|jgi:two-component system chemotaxis sensor kinase CheA|nr:chemotaxis protein CheA [Candidatus Acidoferrum sp.]
MSQSENDSEIVKEFLVESYENLDRLDRDLVGLEKNPHDKEALAGVFRTIHTIKGTCGFLGFNKLEKVTHVGENLLTRLRDGQLTLNPELTTAMLGMVDAVRQMLSQIEMTGQEGERDDSVLIATLTRLQQPAIASAKTAADVARKNGSESAEAPLNIGDILMRRAGVTPAEIRLATLQQEEGDPRRLGEILVEQGAAEPADVVDALRIQQHARGHATAADSTVRVNVGLLDKVMNLVGELVLARNQILQFANRMKDSSFLAASQRLNLITTELQAGVMKTRMQPIGNIWDQFPRTVRDVALTCGKEVKIEMEGKETELDKTIIEAIKDPLTHLVRNSVDHGIELPEDRVKWGKDRAGRLILRAFHEGGQVNIEISDDGAGLNVERIYQKAVERGVITTEQATRMTEREIFNLIFLPGFSTAERVTNVSGRGVGMDVVKTNVEKIGGTVDIQSTLGRGTTVRVKIPLTLAIIPALIVTCSRDRYAIPQVSLVELVRPRGEVGKGIELVHGAPVYRLRGRLLPLVYLNRELKLAADAHPTTQMDAAANIVVLQADERQFGLVVDEINDTEEIVVKPLRKQLKTVKIFAGSSIMGDGRVALILDVLGLAQHAGVVTETRDRALTERSTAAAAGMVADKQTFLLFAGPDDSRMAIPLSNLARLEEFPMARVEMSGSHWVTQYRGQILPLIRLNVALKERSHRLRALQAPPTLDSGPIQVLVLNHEGRSFGLVVERILDIVEDRADVRSAANRAAVLYSVVIGNRVTELLDIPAILQSADLSALRPLPATVSAEVAN